MTTAFDLHGRAMVDRAAQHFGGGATVTIRRRHSLLDPVLSSPPTSLLLDGLHAAGATSLTLKTATRLAGRIVAGIRLTISGSVYAVTNEVAAAGNKLTAVTITPGLVAETADETAVAIEAYREFTFYRLRGRQVERLEDGRLATGEQTLLLSTRGATTTPRRDDTVILNGLSEEIEDIQTIQPGATPWGWRVVRKGRAA